MAKLSFGKLKDQKAAPKAAPKKEAEVVDTEVVYDASEEEIEEEEPEEAPVKKAPVKKVAVKKAAPKPEPEEVEEVEEVEEEEEPTPARKPSKSTAVAKVEAKPLVDHAEVNRDLIGFDMEDIDIPKMSLVQKMSDTSKEFTIGTFLFAGSVPLTTDPEDTVACVALKARKYYVEDIPYGDEEMPSIFDSKDEALAAGFSLTYGEDKYCKPHCDLLLLVALPEDAIDSAEFIFEGIGFSRCIYTVKGASFAVARAILTAVKVGHLRGRKICDALWDIGQYDKKNGSKSWQAATARSHKVIEKDTSFIDDVDTRNEFLEFVRDIKEQSNF